MKKYPYQYNNISSNSRRSPRLKAVEALEGLLGDEKPQVRQYALKALARIGKVDKERLEPIKENPEEKDYNVSLARRLMRKARV